MIFFFGTRPGKTEIRNLDTFWIKIFKISSNTVAECSHCKRVYFEEEFSEEMKTSLNNMRLPA